MRHCCGLGRHFVPQNPNEESDLKPLLPKHLALEPFAYWGVIEFDARIGGEYCQGDDAEVEDDMHPDWGILMALYPRHLHVHYWIVGDVDWV